MFGKSKNFKFEFESNSIIVFKIIENLRMTIQTLSFSNSLFIILFMVCLVIWNSFSNVELGQILCLTNLELINVKLGQFHRIAITM